MKKLTFLILFLLCSICISGFSQTKITKTFVSPNSIRKGKIKCQERTISVHKHIVFVGRRRYAIGPRIQPVYSQQGDLIGLHIRSRYFSSSKMAKTSKK